MPLVPPGGSDRGDNRPKTPPPLVRKLLHPRQRARHLLLRHVADAHAPPERGEEREALGPVAVLHGVHQGLPAELRREVGRVGGEAEGVHAGVDAGDGGAGDPAAVVGEEEGEEAVDVDRLAVQQVDVGDHLEEFGEGVAWGGAEGAGHAGVSLGRRGWGRSPHDVP